ncbi:MAG: carboxypeptidase regulatory-like domain-containing protein [Holophagaceae bacterium]
MRIRHLHPLTPLALLVAASPLAAQGVSAQLGGTVTSTSGQAVPGATVTVRNAETGFTRTALTDAGGRFLVASLPVGPYGVSVAKDGFQTAAGIRVNLNLGDAAPLLVKLAPAASAVVEVTATAAQVDTERTAAATLVSPDDIANLPLRNRDFQAFAKLTPGVVVDSQRGNLAIAGQRGINTAINIDGGDYNQPFFGGSTGGAEGKTPFTVSLEAVREFQVITDGASAEYGRMGGGYLNAVTKSGTNEFGGSLFYYERPNQWQANAHSGSRLPPADFKLRQYGFSFGGPILKDKLHFFVAYDAQRRTDPQDQIWGGTNPPAGLYPLDGNIAADAALIKRAGPYSLRADSDVVFARLDWTVNTDHAIQVRFNSSNFKGNVNSGLTFAKEAVSTDDIKTTSFVGQWNWTINGNWYNELRINYVKDEQPRVPTTTIPQVSITNVGTYGSGTNFSREFETKRTQIIETITYVTPTVQVKAGIDYNKTDVAEVFASTQYGSYSFNNIADFRAGNWNQFQQRFSLQGGTPRDSGVFAAAEKELAVFIQSDWRLTPSFKAGLGLRYDRQEHPDFPIADVSNPLGTTLPVTASIPTDTHVSPRLSFTWTPEADGGKSVVRGSLGRYVSRTPSVFLFQVFAENGVRGARITFTSAQAATFGIPRGAAFTPDSPFRFSALPSGATLPALDVFTFAQSFQNPSTDRFNLGYERAFGGWTFGVSGAYAKTDHLERLADINLGTPVANAQGRLVFPSTRPNTNFRQIAVYVSDAESRYQSLTLSAKYDKAGSPFTASLFYTFSKNRDNDSNERNFSSYSTQNTQRPMDDYSWADTDKRNVVTGSVSYQERRWTGIQFGLGFTYLSGSPYTVTRGNDLNNDAITSNDRLLGTQRNGFRTSSTMSVDLKISRTWGFGPKVKLTVSGEVYNLFNEVEAYQRLQWTGGTDAAPTLSYARNVTSSPRDAQIGVRLAF